MLESSREAHLQAPKLPNAKLDSEHHDDVPPICASQTSTKPFGPSILFFDHLPSDEDYARCAKMGFDTIGIQKADEDLIPLIVSAAKARGLNICIDLDISAVPPEADGQNERPGSLLGLPSEQQLALSSEQRVLVDRWKANIQALLDVGVFAFRCVDLARTPGDVWSSLLQLIRKTGQPVNFYAWTPGLTESQLHEFENVGFDFAFSSSCWWDFKADWLNDDAKRVTGVAPAIALATAPNSKWSDNLAQRLRALRLAATYAAGWLMPDGFELGVDYDLSNEVFGLNKLRKELKFEQDDLYAQVVSSADADLAVLLRSEKYALLLNASNVGPALLSPSNLGSRLGGSLQKIAGDFGFLDQVELSPAETLICEIVESTPIRTIIKSPDCDAPRIAIEGIAPCVENGEFPVRVVLGETIIVEADIISDGHEKLAAELWWREDDETNWHSASMVLVSNDRWRTKFVPQRLGRHKYVILAWKDFYSTFVDELLKKHEAGLAVDLEIREGLALVEEACSHASGQVAPRLASFLEQLYDADAPTRRVLMVKSESLSLMREADLRKFLVQSDEITVDAERIAAGFASWYEIFPRSQSGDADRHGTFDDVIKQLPRIAAMGFDVLYFPPIHPIGKINRKGRNNSLTPGPNDVGSPYAIGSDEGGHDAIHPALGTVEDFKRLIDASKKYGIEVALDFAVQCAPDHPWLKEHKEWFDWRPDGSLRYAENPPKKYEDIVNVDFYASGARPALWNALRDIIQIWVDRGVKLFRVDNPHTKPLPFWEWLIADIRGRHPDVVFLAEAFTRPKVMYRLAKIGFSQSYTYFTWRNSKSEFVDYLTELNKPGPRDFFRPHFFVNTPDINPIFLQTSGRAGFLIRAALAATLSGLWGVYNGFELCESTPLRPGKEEYLDSEKYQIRAWNYDLEDNIISEITRLNAIRRSNLALQSHLNIVFQTAFDENVLYFSKSASDGNVVLVAISLDPFTTRDVTIELPLWQFGLKDEGSLMATDLMRDFEFVWHGKTQIVTLHPGSPFCIWRIRPERE